MRYTVDWDAVALQQLAHIWNNAPDRAAITAAAHEVDRELAGAPESKGEDFYGDRLLVAGPLHVVYKVDSAKRRVLVINVWAI